MPEIKCQACGTLFPNEATLRQHGASAHPMPANAAPPSPAFQCAACGAHFSSQIELKEHEAKAHPR